MTLFSALIEKTYCYPLSHLSSGDAGYKFFQARGDGLYPLIKDGDILHIQQANLADLQDGDMTVFERQSGEFAVRFVVGKGWETQKGSVGKTRNRVNGNKGVVEPERLVGWVATIERGGRTRRRDNRFMRMGQIIYLRAMPLMRIFLIGSKMLSLLHPRFFVRDPESSRRCVAEKYKDPPVLFYYSQGAFEGLAEPEGLLVHHFMTRKGRVLNIGCGAGREAFALAEAGFEVVGIDIVPAMIAEAKRHALTSGIPVHFEVKDATAVDYPPKSFDYVLMNIPVYSHIPTRQLRINTLRRIHDLLTPNGILFFSVEYRASSGLSRVSLYSAFRRIAKPILKKRLPAEPGDLLVPYVSPVGTPSKLCYLHFFRDACEVLEELSSANLDGFEDEKSGYWIVRLSREGSIQATVPREVAV